VRMLLLLMMMIIMMMMMVWSKLYAERQPLDVKHRLQT